MTDDRSGDADTGTTLLDRMDADYQPPVLVEPQGGPIPDGNESPDLDDPPE